MYQIKPSRGPSLFGAIFGLLIGVPFMIFWLSKASEGGVPSFGIFFGIAAFILLLVQIFLGFYNASAKDRIAHYDITSKGEESDTLDRLLKSSNEAREASSPELKSGSEKERFCPFCGACLARYFKFCHRCGKEQPSSTDGRN